MRRSAVAVPVLAAAAAAVAVALPAGAPAATHHGARVSLRTTSLGKVLVSSGGRTLYMFGRDTRGHSRCSGACAHNWPPLTTHGAPRAGHGVRASLLGTTRRGGGVRQVTYNGHPLYRFVGDSRAGQTNGEGINAFGGTWHAVGASGAAAKRGASDSSPAPSSPSQPEPPAPVYPGY